MSLELMLIRLLGYHAMHAIIITTEPYNYYFPFNEKKKVFFTSLSRWEVLIDIRA